MSPVPVQLHPEFAESVSAKMGAALLTLLRADAALRNYYTGGIVDAELEEVWEVQGGGYALPALLVIANAVEDEPRPHLDWDRTQFFELVDCARTTTREEATRGWFRTRRLDHIKRVILGTEGTGVLCDPDGAPVSEGLVTFLRWPEPVIIPGRSEIRSRVSVAWRALINQSMEFIG